MKPLELKTICVAIVLMLVQAAAFAQTQQGYVKTRGRMVNGKLVPGQGLKGATVSIKGRTTILVNSDDGSFSFPVSGQQFQIDSVKKKGYQLVDLEACPKTYHCSSNPIYIVMENPEQLMEDEINAERKIRRSLQKQLQEKEDQLESLREEGRITEEAYQDALQNLYAEQEGNERIIADMARRYAELDYDQLDDFYRQVSYLIENGELTKADSLLRTRGDITKQVNEILQRGQALNERKDVLQKAKTMQDLDVDEAARYCLRMAEYFRSQNESDSVDYYLDLHRQLTNDTITGQPSNK